MRVKKPRDFPEMCENAPTDARPVLCLVHVTQLFIRYTIDVKFIMYVYNFVTKFRFHSMPRQYS